MISADRRTAATRMPLRTSVAMTAAVDDALCRHLVRDDGQEDLCLATYRPSTGLRRLTALLGDVHLPEPGERYVHGNATVTGDYMWRIAVHAADRGEGVVMLHSHPGGRGWQQMSGPDYDAESAYAKLAREMTGLPLVGMTLAGRDLTWSARHWNHGFAGDVAASGCENVRVVGDHLRVFWDDAQVPPPPPALTNIRSVTSWGTRQHADVTRRSVLVVGLGSVGLDVAVRLAATGLTRIGLMDYDTIETHNLDRLIGATAIDAWLRRSKIEVARRLVIDNATSSTITVEAWDLSVCEPEGLAAALDYDQIICAVDRPWPRAVLNLIAYRDYIPVVDGGIAIDTFEDGTGMRNATWRSHVLRPGRPCMSCNGQLDLGAVAADRSGALDDPAYIAGHNGRRAREERRNTSANVAVLSISAAASVLAQYVSLNVAPGGLGEPGPLQYLLSSHTLEHLDVTSRPACPVEVERGRGDDATRLAGPHPAADAERRRHDAAAVGVGLRLMRTLDDARYQLYTRRIRRAERRLRRRHRRRG
jgi:molybdopterin-synthase adenylyltransferase